MRALVRLVGPMLLVLGLWPWLGNPFDYRHPRDSLRTVLPIALIFGRPCTARLGAAIVHDGSPACVRFAAPRRFAGIWLDEFEGSVFLENAMAVPARRPVPGQAAWLTGHVPRSAPAPTATGCYPIRAFAVDFVGRRSPVGHGHLGGFGTEIWVDRLLAARPLPAPDCRTF